MDLWNLREFTTLAERLNFSEAARHLYIAQPVLSRHIAELEQELGVQLFIRNRHSVQLTTIGELLLKESYALLARYEETLQKIHMAASGLEGSVKIGFLDAAVKAFLAPFATQFTKTNPKIQLQLFSFEFVSNLTEALRRNEIDVGFTITIGSSHSTELSYKTVYNDVFSAVMHCDHPLAKNSVIDVADLANEPFIQISREQNPEGFHRTLAICKARGFVPNIVRETPRMDAVLLMVEMGLGISIMPRHTKVYASPAIRYIDLKGDDCNHDVVLAWKTNNSNPALLPLLKEYENVSQSLFTKLNATNNQSIPTTDFTEKKD
ncbi:MAG: transcriptional regulator AlsR family [Firmicutes bacterium]|nr:transcriptional regulator AlsR family [Bacillota bacterium]